MTLLRGTRSGNGRLGTRVQGLHSRASAAGPSTRRGTALPSLRSGQALAVSPAWAGCPCHASGCASTAWRYPRWMALRQPLLEPARSAFGARAQQLPPFCFWLLPNPGINQRWRAIALFCLLPNAETDQRQKAVAAATALRKRAAPARKGACFLTGLGQAWWVGAPRSPLMNLTREGRRHMVMRRERVAIGNSA